MSHKLTPFYLPIVSDNQRVYVSGPMTGMPDSNRKAFGLATIFLRATGLSVCNPVETSTILGSLEHHDFLRFDFARILEADSVFALAGWEESPGSRVEILMALSMGLRVWAENATDVTLEQVVQAIAASRLL